MEKLKELLEEVYYKDGKKFKTDEIRIHKDLISIWDLDKETWYYLNSNGEWIDNLEEI